MITYWWDLPIRLKVQSGPDIPFTDGLKTVGPVHMGDDVSPRRGKIILVFDLL